MERQEKGEQRKSSFLARSLLSGAIPATARARRQQRTVQLCSPSPVRFVRLVPYRWVSAVRIQELRIFHRVIFHPKFNTPQVLDSGRTFFVKTM